MERDAFPMIFAKKAQRHHVLTANPILTTNQTLSNQQKP
jgi:hypothetical protein